jgi:hypothetical protein
VITLAGTDRTATSATAEFFNGGSVAGTFDAVLRFFDVGAPVGAQIGSGFSATGISVGAANVVDVLFSNLGNVFLPDSVVFTLEISNVSAGLDLGVTMFNPPTLGTSSNQNFITQSGATFALSSTGTSTDNVFFSLDATTAGIPEPGTMLLTLAGVPTLAWMRRRTSTAKNSADRRAAK